MKKRQPVAKRTRPAVEHDKRIPEGLDRLARETEGEPYCGFFRLTHEMAKDWRDNHVNESLQRKRSPATLATMQRVRAQGFWTDYQAEVVFDANWDLRNGQHVVASAAEEPCDDFIIHVMINLPPRVCDMWDMVRTRSAADALQIRGFKFKSYDLSKAAKVLWQYLNKVYEGMGYLADRSRENIAAPPEAVRIVEQNLQLQQCIIPMNKCFDGKQFSRAALHAAYFILRQIDAKDADKFFERLNDGVLPNKDPIWALRDLFLGMAKKERFRNGYTMALVVKTWNLHRAGKKIAGRLRMEKNEPFPLLEPMEIPDGPHSARVQ